jgi:hypothetical protein
VDRTGKVTAVAEGLGGIVARSGGVSDTAWIWVAPTAGGAAGSLTPANLQPVVGQIVMRRGTEPQIARYDNRYLEAEGRTYTAWVNGGRKGADASSHYGALRSRYEWSMRNGLPVGPAAPPNSPYAHGAEMTRIMITRYAKPNKYKIPPHNNTALRDVELLYLIEGDGDARAYLEGIAQYYGAAYIDRYFDLSGPNSDPRSSAILLQTLNLAERHQLRYTGRAAWGSSWKEAAATIVGRITNRIPATGEVVSLAHKNSGQGDEAFFMNAMLATELLRWHGYVEPQPSWVALATRIMDHLVDEHAGRDAPCLPYLSKARGCAEDLAGFYVWPALVLWQETGDMKYRDFALANIRAAQQAYIQPAKQFNQIYSTGAQSAEALLSGVPWR